jgi:hypothetical protein
VDVVRVHGEIGATLFVRQLLREAVVDADRFRDRPEVDGVASEEIDPEELVGLDRSSQCRFERYRSVVAVGVVEPRLDVRGPACAQRTTARRVTTTMATIAVPYWRTFIAISAFGRPVSAARSGTPSMTSWTIDVCLLSAAQRGTWAQRRSSAIQSASAQKPPASQKNCSAVLRRKPAALR